MTHRTHNKNMFQRVLTILFFSLLFLGVADMASAQEEVLTGTAKGPQRCDDGDGGVDKDKFKEDITLFVTRTPDSVAFEGGFSIAGSLPFEMVGSTFPKNKKSGIFSAIALDILNPSSEGIIVTLLGKYKLDKTGALVKASGKFILQTFSDFCLISGTFKTKLDPDAVPPPA